MPSPEIIEVELVEREIITVEFSVIDFISRNNVSDLQDTNITNPQEGQVLVYEDGILVNKDINFIIDVQIIQNETPIAVNPLPSPRFSTANAYRSESLQVFLNGLKIHTSEITQHSDTEFSLPIDAISTDMIEVSYIKK